MTGDWMAERDAAMARRAALEAEAKRQKEEAVSRASLFGTTAIPETPIARNTDPWTSHEAGRRFLESGKRDGYHQRILRYLASRVDMPPKTATEIAALSGIPTAHKRLPELERMGKVIRCEARLCSITLMPATTWKAAPSPASAPESFTRKENEDGRGP